MDDFLEIGIEAADKLVDKHFHKIPDKALQSQTYNPREYRKRHRNRRRSSPSNSESESKPPPPMSRDPLQNSGGVGVAPPPPTEYTYVPYSHESPHLRPEYTPSPQPIGQPYYSPPPQSTGRSQRRRYEDDDYDDDDGYYSDRKPRRPLAITRRSSSYHGPRGQDDYYDSRQLVHKRRGSSRDGSDTASRSRDGGGRHGFKDEAEKYFTKSPIGITGAVAGAVVGGWAAKQAQVASAKEGGRHHGSNPLLTLLGAAAGGLAVNAVIDKFEDRKKDTAEKQRDWEDKWGVEDEKSSRRGRRDSGHSRRRHRSRSYSSDGYD